MSLKQILIFAVLWQVLDLASCSLSHVNYGNMKAINWGLPLAGHKLNATPITTSKVSNRIQCMAKCGKTKGCVSINLGPSQAGEHECALLETTRHGSTFPNLTIATGWTYLGPKTKCDKNPCPDKQGIRCVARETENDHICLDINVVTSCQEYRDLGFTSSGIYILTPRPGIRFEAYCKMDHLGKGWTVFMRNDGQQAGFFNQDWATYQNGFGDLNSNFWLGNELLHQITKDKPHELHVDLRKSGSAGGYVYYTGFQVSDKDNGYRLTFDASSYSGTGGSSLSHNNNMKFSTPDKDFDLTSVNCAAERKVGWWFNYCSYATPTRVPIVWGSWGPQYIDLKLRAMSA